MSLDDFLGIPKKKKVQKKNEKPRKKPVEKSYEGDPAELEEKEAEQEDFNESDDKKPEGLKQRGFITYSLRCKECKYKKVLKTIGNIPEAKKICPKCAGEMKVTIKK